MKRSARKAALIVAGLVLVLVAGALGWWTATAYHADAIALAAIADEGGSADGVVVRKLADGSVAFVADEPVAGLVFYPGGNVQPEAYASLLTLCAQEGVTSVLVRPPLNFALLDVDAAEGVFAQFPEVDTWLLAGHSLGGVAACECLGRHASEYDAIVLLASYSATDLTGYDGEVLLLLGTEDGVLSRDKYDAARGLLPDDAKERRLEGGNHAQYGNYGKQKGDGIPTITREEQQRMTAEDIAALAREVAQAGR